jgi:hypothetical protein
VVGVWCSVTPWSSVLLDNLTVAHIVKNCLSFCGSWRFITVFTAAYHWPLFRAKLTQSTDSRPVFKMNFNTIPPSTPSFASGLFYSDVPTRMLCVDSVALMRTTCPAHLLFLWFDCPSNTLRWVLYCADFSSLLLLSPSYVQILFYATCSQNSLIYVLFLLLKSILRKYFMRVYQLSEYGLL